MSVALEDMSEYARSVVSRLGLEAHPEGGWYIRDWQSPHIDGGSARPLASLIYFLLPQGDASAWHKVDADEIWLWHGPAPVTLQLGVPQTTGSKPSCWVPTSPPIGMMPRYADTRWCRPESGNAPCPAPATHWSPA